MKIETIRLKNFKVFQNAELLQIPAFCVVVGANGSGKSTLFDVFHFLKDCLAFNVTTALQSRGGFREVVSREHETIFTRVIPKFSPRFLRSSSAVSPAWAWSPRKQPRMVVCS